MATTKNHYYTLQLNWTGNLGTGTSSYRAYGRDYSVAAAGKPFLLGSSDPAFRGDASRYNPEEMLLAALSSCHLLWFLHLCAEAGVVVTAYADAPTATMATGKDGGGQFVEATLHPSVTVQEAAMLAPLPELHGRASQLCFIARSVNFPIRHLPSGKVA
jgi:organic hydroperoxide reductase OsmC/OhrA